MITTVENETDRLLSVPQLRERGWTPALIKRFLGNPDGTRPNPYYRSAAPMQLYDAARVGQIETAVAFLEAKQKAAVRSQRGQAIARRKAQELVEQARQTPISVRHLPATEIQQRAIDSFNGWKEMLLIERGHEYEPAGKHSDPTFLQRISVNYIRHQLTKYDHYLERAAGKAGVAEAVDVIRGRIYQAIAESYPDLAVECRRQQRDREYQE